jgi:hypothetical protein
MLETFWGWSSEAPKPQGQSIRSLPTRVHPSSPPVSGSITPLSRDWSETAAVIPSHHTHGVAAQYTLQKEEEGGRKGKTQPKKRNQRGLSNQRRGLLFSSPGSEAIRWGPNDPPARFPLLAPPRGSCGTVRGGGAVLFPPLFWPFFPEFPVVFRARSSVVLGFLPFQRSRR